MIKLCRSNLVDQTVAINFCRSNCVDQTVSIKLCLSNCVDQTVSNKAGGTTFSSIAKFIPGVHLYKRFHLFRIHFCANLLLLTQRQDPGWPDAFVKKSPNPFIVLTNTYITLPLKKVGQFFATSVIFTKTNQTKQPANRRKFAQSDHSGQIQERSFCSDWL
jgi:hypothetical protein